MSSNGTLLVDSHNRLVDQFAKWLYKQTKDGGVIGYPGCASFLNRVSGRRTITDGDVSGFISRARPYCEKNLGCTIKWVQGNAPGWRISTPEETAIYYGGWIKRSFAAIERTMILKQIVDPKHIDLSIKEVLRQVEGRLEKLSPVRRRFTEQWLDYIKEERKKQLETTQKEITSGKN